MIADQINSSKIKNLFFKSLARWMGKHGDIFVYSMLNECEMDIIEEETYKKRYKSNTMCTDGIKIYASEGFIRNQGRFDAYGSEITSIDTAYEYIIKRCMFVIGHEVYHIVNKHIQRAKMYEHDMELSNIIQDAIINVPLLMSLSNDIEAKPIMVQKEDTPEGKMTPFDKKGKVMSGIFETELIEMFQEHFKIKLSPDITKRNYEYVYDFLKEELEKKNKENKSQNRQGQPQPGQGQPQPQNGQGQGQPGQGNEPGQGNGDNPFNLPEELLNRVLDPDTHTNQKKEDDMKETQEKLAISRALKRTDEARSSGRGTEPSGLERLAHQALVVETPWEEKLKHAFGTGKKMGLNFKKPNKRRLYMQGIGKPIIPSKGKKPERNVIFAVDTSGSMSSKDIQNGANNIYSIIQNSNGRFDTTLEIWSCDADVQKNYKLSKYDDMPEPLQLTGMGGTSFVPVFKEARRSIKTALDAAKTTLVYITDTYGDAHTVQEMGEEYTNIHTIWLVTGCNCMVEARRNLPFGEIIMIND